MEIEECEIRRRLSAILSISKCTKRKKNDMDMNIFLKGRNDACQAALSKRRNSDTSSESIVRKRDRKGNIERDM